ncbi:MAG: TRAP transporter permease [Alphaproteobacteria bacterium]|nr:TRAP transporter permease [Alphaproteobacteria bacterium]
MRTNGEPAQPFEHSGTIEAESLRLRELGAGWQALLQALAVLALLFCINQLFNLRLFLGQVILDNEYFYLLLALLLPPVFLLFPAGKRAPLRRVPWYDVVLALLALAVLGYLFSQGRKAVEQGWEFGAPAHVVFACYAIWLLVLEALRRTGGRSLTICVGLISLYPIVADRMPSPLSGLATSLPDTAAYHMLSTESLLGIAIRAFAELVIGFLVFGVALQYTGAGAFFINFAFALFGHVRGGAAKVAIFASGLLGSMSGSVVTNVLTAGTMTIPTMIRTGFRPSYAASIEACASTGAVLMPPVMGATAFVMAQFLAVPYTQVAFAAAIPSLLYYFGLFMQVDAYAARHGLAGIPRAELPRLWPTIRDGWYYLAVVALLVWMLLVLKREATAPFYATALLLLINQILPQRRWDWLELKRFLTACAKLFVELVAILAGVGLLIGAFSVTGMTGTLTNDLIYLAGDNPLVLLLTGAIASFVLGLGLTTTACYIFLAVLLAPGLIKQGLDPMAVHMFILYWGMLSFITPPVALASFAAASIARSEPMQTSFESMWVGSIIYFVPFFFVLNPALIGNGPWLDVLQLVGSAVLGVMLICAGLQGYLLLAGDLTGIGPLQWPLRLALIVGGALFAAPGGGLMPLQPLQMELLALAVTAPAALIAWWLARKR